MPRPWAAYQFHSRLSIFLDCERIGDIQARLDILQQQKSLVRALCGTAFLGSQGDAQCVGASERDRFG